MTKELFRQDAISKALAYGVKCAIAKSKGEKLPRPNRTVDLILYKYQIQDSVDVARRDMVKALSCFGGSIYYYLGEFADGKPSQRFMVDRLQRTGFFQILDFLETQIDENRFYPADHQIWLEIPTVRQASMKVPAQLFA